MRAAAHGADPVPLYQPADPGHLCHCPGGGYSKSGHRLYPHSKRRLDQQSGRGDKVGQLRLFWKKALDKQEKIAYNKSEESIPADGLLPQCG